MAVTLDPTMADNESDDDELEETKTTSLHGSKFVRYTFKNLLISFGCSIVSSGIFSNSNMQQFVTVEISIVNLMDIVVETSKRSM